MNYNKLSADPTALILGIISLVILFLGCCCGFLAVISLALGIVGLVLATKSLKEYDQSPENYSHQSRQNVYIGKILSLIGTILSGIFLLVIVLFLLVYQMSFTTLLKEKFEEARNNDRQTDSTYIKKEVDGMYEEKDTTYTDSITVEEIKK
jgi:predicted membrane protein